MNEWIPKAYAADSKDSLTAIWQEGVKFAQDLKATDKKTADDLYEALKVAVSTRGSQLSAAPQTGASQ
ncbi:hypothetical protein D3C77_593240 [compost metagenome]